MAQQPNTEYPHASKQIAPYRTRECGPTARIASKRIPRECDADLTNFPPALSLKAQTQAARSILHRPPGRAAPTSQRRISRADTAPRLNAAMSQSLDARQDLIGQCQSRRSWGDVQPAKLSRESAQKSRQHGKSQTCGTRGSCAFDGCPQPDADTVPTTEQSRSSARPAIHPRFVEVAA